MYNKILISLLSLLFISQVFAVEAILSNGNTVKVSEITFLNNEFILKTETGKMILNPAQIQSFSFYGSQGQAQSIILQNEKVKETNKSSIDKDLKIKELEKQIKDLTYENSVLSIDNYALRARLKALMEYNGQAQNVDLPSDSTTTNVPSNSDIYSSNPAIPLSNADKSLSNKIYYSINTETDTIDRSNEKAVGQTPTGLTIYEGPRGGKYHYSKSGNKVYERKKK